MTQSVQVAGEGGSSQSLQVAGGGEISQSAPVTGGGAEEASAVVAGPKTADEMLDEMLEDLNKVEQKPTAAVVKSVRATEAAGSGAMQRLSPEQRRWLANAAEAMMAGQPVGLGALPDAQDVQQQTLVPAGEAGQRPHFLPVALYLLMAMVKLDTIEVTTGEIMVATIKVAREVAGYKGLKDEGTIRDKDMK